MVMDIIAILRRAEAKHRELHGRRPNRILLKGEMIQAFADMMVDRFHSIDAPDARNIAKRQPDEIFLDGGVAFFKGIPVIAELRYDQELIISDDHAEASK